MYFSRGSCGIVVCWLWAVSGAAFGQAAGHTPLAICVLDFDTNLKENRSVAGDLSTAMETALGKRRNVFRMVERKSVNEIVKQNKAEEQLKAFVRGDKPPAQLMQQLKGIDAFVRGVFSERLGIVTLTVSLTGLDTEKLWQGQRRHNMYDWLNPDTQEKEAESLAAEAAATLLPSPAVPKAGDDGPRGLELAKGGKCTEARAFLENAIAIDTGNAELYFWLGRCQQSAGDTDGAARSFTSAIAQNNHRADLFTERARCLADEKLFERSLRDLDQALRLDSNYLPAIELRGDIYLATGKSHDAMLAYDSVYQRLQTQAVCHKLAEAHRKEGDTSNANVIERSCTSIR
jgi:tetratricopeptide (TPR) repeat protein